MSDQTIERIADVVDTATDAICIVGFIGVALFWVGIMTGAI